MVVCVCACTQMGNHHVKLLVGAARPPAARKRQAGAARDGTTQRAELGLRPAQGAVVAAAADGVRWRARLTKQSQTTRTAQMTKQPTPLCGAPRASLLGQQLPLNRPAQLLRRPAQPTAHNHPAQTHSRLAQVPQRRRDGSERVGQEATEPQQSQQPQLQWRLWQLSRSQPQMWSTQNRQPQRGLGSHTSYR